MRWRYAYCIDPSVISPREINQRWQQQHRGGRLENAFYVLEPSEQRGLCTVHAVDQDNSWWLAPGSGSTVVDASDEQQDRALLGFFIGNIEAFTMVTYGPASPGFRGMEQVHVLFSRGSRELSGEAV